jgi:hypothetical protein
VLADVCVCQRLEGRQYPGLAYVDDELYGVVNKLHDVIIIIDRPRPPKMHAMTRGGPWEALSNVLGDGGVYEKLLRPTKRDALL